MATYAIGDVHGCFETLRALVRRIGFRASRDRLWLVGDLVNRGPASLSVLRWAADMGDGLVVVLGNHDLHLLGRAAGVAERRRRDTLEEVLVANDRDDLLGWLRSRPLLHHEGDRVLVHAGLLPQWTVEQAAGLARETEARLRGRASRRLLRQTTKRADRWRESLSAGARARVALAAMTRMRALTAEGRLCAEFSGAPTEMPPGCHSWFEAPDRRNAEVQIVCGHWAALGLYLTPGVAALDTGCVWGRCLTALRIEDQKIFQEPTRDDVSG